MLWLLACAALLCNPSSCVAAALPAELCLLASPCCAVALSPSHPAHSFRFASPRLPSTIRARLQDFDRGRVWELKVMSEHASDREHWVQLLLLHGAHRSGEGASAPASKTGAAGAMRSSGATTAAAGASAGAAAGAGSASGAASAGSGGGGIVHGGLAPNGYDFSKHPDVWEACEAPAPVSHSQRHSRR